MDVNQVITNEIAILIGENAKEVLDKAFFTDDITPIKASLIENGMEIETINQIMEEWNYDTIQCKSTGITNFAKIQYEIAQNVIEDRKENLLRNCAVKEVHLDSEQKYANIAVYGSETVNILSDIKKENTYTM